MALLPIDPLLYFYAIKRILKSYNRVSKKQKQKIMKKVKLTGKLNLKKEVISKFEMGLINGGDGDDARRPFGSSARAQICLCLTTALNCNNG